MTSGRLPGITALRGLSSRLLAISLGVLVALALIEGGLRLFQLAPHETLRTVSAAGFERVPGLFTPGQDFVSLKKPALPHRIRINALGYRGGEIDSTPRPEALRVLMIGDSFTFGDFVDSRETLPVQLEGMLRRDCGEVPMSDVTVINAGVGGTTIVGQREMARRALPLEPDLVVLTFSENDVVDLRRLLWHELAENRRMKSRLPFSILYPALHHTALGGLALRLRAELTRGSGASGAGQRTESTAKSERGKVSGEAERGSLEPPSSKDEPAARESVTPREPVDSREPAPPTLPATPGQRAYAQHLAELQAMLDERDLPLVFVAFPSNGAVRQRGEPELLAWVVAEARSLGLPAVSLWPALRASGRSVNELYLLPEDGHPSPLGYEVAAAHLVRELAWPTLTDGRCRPQSVAP